MEVKLKIIGALLFISGCLFLQSVQAQQTRNTQGNVVDLVNLKEFPVWFRDAMAREKSVKSKSKLTIRNFNISNKILGKVKLIDSTSDTWYYQIEIGTGTPVECYVLTNFDGPANSLNGIIESNLSEIEKLNKKPLTNRFNYALGSGLVGDTPYLLLDTLYVLGEGESKASGVLKGASARTNRSLQVCMHNELGYRATFLSVFKSFVNAFVESEKNLEFFEAVLQMRINGMVVGYGREKYSLDEDGDIAIQTDSAMLVPVDASSVARSDSVSRSWSAKDGSLINKTSYSVDNGALSFDFSLQKHDGKWRVDGELQGKAVQAELKHSDWLLSEYGSYVETVALIKSEKNSGEFFMWVPEADPTSALKVVLSKIPNNSDANFKIDMGPLVMKFMAENNGIFKRGTMVQGAVTIGLEQVYVKGEPVLP